MASVFIVDDDESLCQMLANLAGKMGHEVRYAHSLNEGLSGIDSELVDVVFLDVGLPDGNGLQAIPKIRKNKNRPEIVIVTGEGTTDGAELAIKYGAWSYLQKPLSKKEIQLALAQVCQYRQNPTMPQPQPAALKLDGIIGNSDQMRECYDALARASVSNVNVLIGGETGTGKEVFAKAIHANSASAANRFVVVDCAALPETLIESTLFGYKKGAFTGADQDRVGLIEEADGGTLFLDEIGEMPKSMQKAFLRVLQERRFKPVGSTQEQQSDFRLIAATNRNLEGAVAEGSFRADLFHRLKGIALELAPLRERQADINELAINYTNKICTRYKTEPKGLSSDFIDALIAYPWPGNVRELIHTLEAAISKAMYEPVLYAKHLSTQIRIQLAKESVSTTKSSSAKIPDIDVPDNGGLPTNFPSYQQFSDSLNEQERKYLLGLLEFTKGNISQASQVSGLSRQWLHKLLKKHQISRKYQ